jgi:hypothetical protein
VRYFPGAHATHVGISPDTTVLPYFPFAQDIHKLIEFAFGTKMYFACGHCLHVLFESAPKTSLYVPSGQSVQLPGPTFALNVPAGHVLQVLFSRPVRHTQSVRIVLPGGLSLSTGQFLQSLSPRIPDTSEYVWAVQFVHPHVSDLDAPLYPELQFDIALATPSGPTPHLCAGMSPQNAHTVLSCCLHDALPVRYVPCGQLAVKTIGIKVINASKQK